MRAIILAAGQGTRLRPYTDDKPKCMVELEGIPLLHRQLNALHSVGIDDILLVGGYRADKLETDGVKIALNPRYAETNMVATLFCAEDWMSSSEDLLIAYGDIVYQPSVLNSLMECDAPMAISVDREWRRFWAIRMDDPLSDAETLKLDDDNCIIELGKKPLSYDDIQGQYMGLIKIRADHVDAFRLAWHNMDKDVTYDGKDFDNMYMTSFLQYLIDNGFKVCAAFTDNGWLEVDTVEDLEQYHQMYKDGSLNRFISLES